jgi:hypothetical protein
VEIVALLTEYTMYESYINATRCLNTVLKICKSIQINWRVYYKLHNFCVESTVKI